MLFFAKIATDQDETVILWVLTIHVCVFKTIILENTKTMQKIKRAIFEENFTFFHIYLEYFTLTSIFSEI